MQKVQSVILNKDSFTLEQACNWILKNNFQIKKIDSTLNTFRFRQYSPQALRKEGYNNYRTVSITPNAQLVIAYSKQS